jgi:hypothetical protein
VSRRLNESLFINFNEARQIIEEWRIARSTDRPHPSLNGSHRPSLQPRTTGANPELTIRDFAGTLSA